MLLDVPEDVAAKLHAWLEGGGEGAAEDVQIELGGDVGGMEPASALYVDGERLTATAAALPTIVEVHKSLDSVNFFKACDLGHVVVARHDKDELPKGPELPNGLTPPTERIRKRMWRKRPQYDPKEVEQVAVELEALNGGSLKAEFELTYVEEEVPIGDEEEAGTGAGTGGGTGGAQAAVDAGGGGAASGSAAGGAATGGGGGAGPSGEPPAPPPLKMVLPLNPVQRQQLPPPPPQQPQQPQPLPPAIARENAAALKMQLMQPRAAAARAPPPQAQPLSQPPPQQPHTKVNVPPAAPAQPSAFAAAAAQVRTDRAQAELRRVGEEMAKFRRQHMTQSNPAMKAALQRKLDELGRERDAVLRQLER